jgi:hypothetical protein
VLADDDLLHVIDDLLGGSLDVVHGYVLLSDKMVDWETGKLVDWEIGKLVDW